MTLLLYALLSIATLIVLSVMGIVLHSICRAPDEPEEGFGWPGHSFRVIEHDPAETVEQRFREAS